MKKFIFVHLKKALLLFLTIGLFSCVSTKRYKADIITVGRVGKLIENTYTLRQIEKLEKTEIQKDTYFMLKQLLELRKFTLEHELILEGIDNETIKKIEK